MAQSTTYMLSSRDRDTEESTRLDFQHAFLKSTFADRLLHPKIPDLGPGAYVADVGTGNGVWLNDLARTLAGDNKDANYKNNSASQANSRAAQLVGFDVTSEKFAEQNETGVKMVVHDCTERFPQEWWGLFDVVHLRLLVYAIREADVKRVVWNVIELLRPGGYLQWQDTDLNDIWCTPPSPTLDLAIENINVERLARGLSLCMPATIAKALLAPQMHSDIAKQSVRKDVLRILTLDTISSPTSAPAEIKQAGQRVLTEVLRILLHAGAARNRSLRSREDVYPDGSVSRLDYRNRLYAEAEENEKLVKKLDRELEEAALKLNTSMTWILAQKSSSRADSPDN